MKGFTLFELLIAMLLTAIIGAVMFRTWDLVIQSGEAARKAVSSRERERVAFGIIDNDIAALVMGIEGEGGMPRLSRNAIMPEDSFYEVMGRKKERLPEGSAVLLSFATGSSLGVDGPRADFPVCVEYHLRMEGEKGRALIRRERDNCGINGDFPWRETRLMGNLALASFELLFRDGTKLGQWTDDNLKSELTAIKLRWKREGAKEEEALFPVFERREEIGWEDEKE